ncbi:MAG: SulP family sulfate permease, partial [Patiriisocius sp.]
MLLIYTSTTVQISNSAAQTAYQGLLSAYQLTIFRVHIPIVNTDSLAQWQLEWFGNIRADILAGLVVALALIPEAIAFSIIAGVDPKVGLYASFSIAVIVSITGGRPGMISAATAATAVLMVTLVKEYGLEYLLAATILAGLLQIVA